MAITRNVEAVETEYITGEMSLNDLAQKHEIPLSTLSRWCEDGDWVNKRGLYRADLASKTVEMAQKAELSAREMVGKAAASAYKAFIGLSDSKRGDRAPELLKLWAAMSGEPTDHSVNEVQDLRDYGLSEATIADLDRVARERLGAGHKEPALTEEGGS